MYLKKLELKGFKSFPNKIEILFKEGITSIVGPNGSGKSNISDAIRWILGEQSTKNLRADKLEDVIFSGTEDKKAMNICEASITIDNSEMILNTDYSEVNIKRAIYRSGDSEFYLNNKLCRLKDIKELFLDTGIGKEGYSIIEQGKIDDILSTTSDNRRKIFDEACGISKYRYKKLESQKNLKVAKENLDRINDIFCEINAQLTPLSIQKNKALEYVDLKNKLKILEVNNYINEIQNLDNNLKEFNNHKDLLSIQIDEIKKNVDMQKQDLLITENNLDSLDKKIDSNKEQIFFLKTQFEATKSNNTILNEKLKNLNSQRDKIQTEIENIKQKVNEVAEQIIQSNNSFLDREEKLKYLNNKKEKLEFKTNDFIKTLKINDIKLEELKNSLINILNQENAKKVDLSTYENNIKNLNDRNLILEEEETKIYEKQCIFENDITENINKKIISLDKIKEYKKECNHLETEKNLILREVKNLQKEEKRNEENLNDIKSKLNVYLEMEKDYEGFNKGVKSILKNKTLIGTIGTFAHIIQVPKEFETAIEVALGYSLQNMITTDEESAKNAIEYLKKHNLGRVTFLPLTTIKAKNINVENIKHEDGFIGIASEYITYSFEYKNIVDYMLGRTILVKDINSAIKIARITKYMQKIVTLDGEVFNAGGSLSGGSLKAASINILSRKRLIDEFTNLSNDISKTIYNISNKKDKLYLDIENIEKKINDIILSTHKKEKCIAILENIIKGLQDKDLSLNADKQKIKREKSVLKENLSYMIKNLDKCFEEVIIFKEKYLTIEAQINDVSKENENEKKLYENDLNILNDLKINIATLEQSISNEKKEVDRLKIEMDILENSYKEKNNNLNSIFKDYEITLENLILSKTELEQLNEKCTYVEEKLTFYQEEKQKILKHITRKKISLEDGSKKLDELKQSLYKLDIKIERLNISHEGYYDKLWNDYEMTFLEALKLKDKDLFIDKQKIENIKIKIKSLGNVNIESIEEYKIVKERYEFYNEQREDLEKSIVSIELLIKDLEVNMKNEFKKNFEKINKSFSDVYKRLFNGGEAYLDILDNNNLLESDIDIRVKPPGKNLKTINLLSGGEKALTAICILFAILLIKPTPFCVLDEIEAPLDDANIYRFAEFLKEISSKTQFIIITHRRGTMNVSDYIYGITMVQKGISSVVSLKLEDAQNLSEKD